MSVAKLKKVIWTIFKYATLLLAIFIAVLPLVSCVITAFKTPEEYASTNVMQLPQSWTYFENFIQAWKQANMATAFRNSFIILVFVLFGSIMTGSMLAYVLSRFKFKGNGLIRNLFCLQRSFRELRCRCRYIRLCIRLGGSTVSRGILSSCVERMLFPFIFSFSFLRIYQLHWMNQRSWTDVPISECFSVSCCRS